MINNINKIFICALFVFGTLASYGQEVESKSSNMKVIPTFNPPAPKNNLLGLKAEDSSYKTPVDLILKSILKAEQRNLLNNKGIIDPQKIHEEKLKKEMAELNRQYAKIDQYLGGFSSTSESITIACRDFQYPDGDIVSIFVNNEPIVRNIVLTTAFKQFKIPLKKGLNVISFVAVNQGSSGPNTAAFMVFDENAKVLTSDEWNLATGAKATISIARIDD